MMATDTMAGMDRGKLALAVREVQGIRGRCEGEGMSVAGQREVQGSRGRGSYEEA